LRTARNSPAQVKNPNVVLAPPRDYLVSLLMSSDPTLSSTQMKAGFQVEPGIGVLPELLAPAGDWECAKAAVENGADAIYFGLEKFNARMRAHNFTEADLAGLMKFLHGRGVKGYVTFNTLVFENELAQAEQYIRTIITAGVDAAIVQDIGICRLIRRLSPDFPIHVSTQMTITSRAGLDFARELGCNLVVLARECSLPEIEKILHGTEQNGTAKPLPLEVFVHGALCVAYSGQCLTSEALGGRSANRGECAQACRMPYELLSDGRKVELGNRKYLLSPQDLAGLELLPELKRLGVASLKIEGRLKAPEYVANITRLYRDALDRLGATKGSTTTETQNPSGQGAKYRMEMAFSRGLFTGWFRGINNQSLVHGFFGKKRGVYLGEVTEVRRDSVRMLLNHDLQPGDGVVFDAGKPEDCEEGGRVYEVILENSSRKTHQPPHDTKALSTRTVVLRFGQGDVNFNRIHAGNKVWKTSDPRLEKDLRRSYEGDLPKFHRPLTMEVHGKVDQELTLIVRDDNGHVVRCVSSMPLSRAEKRPLTTKLLREQLGRLGGTGFRLGPLENNLANDVLLPMSELNRMRRKAIGELQAQREQPTRWTLDSGASGLETERQAPRPTVGPPQLSVLVRNLGQLDGALNHGLRTIYCEFEDPKKYREAVARFRERRLPNASVIVAPPRIFKTGEEWILRQVISSEPDGYLVRNFDHLKFFAGQKCIGDYSLNVANRLSADYFKNKFSLERLTASYDLNFAQLEALLQGAPPEWFEVTLHQHIPMFHMEHCVFCAFLSSGTDYTNCGRPCDEHQVELRDRVGAEHPVKADAGCRNTVFNSRAQTGAEYAARLLELGLRNFRIEFLNETPELVNQTIRKYQQLLVGEISGAQLWRELKLMNQLGVTRGQIAGTQSA
jgi:U32 family peptidase